MNIKKRFRFITCSIIFIFISSFCSTSFASRIEAIIFDCDGVLVDTEQLKFIAWKVALNKKGIVLFIEDYIPLIGHSAKNILTNILSNRKYTNIFFQDIIHDRNKIYKSLHLQKVKIYKQAINFLNETIRKKHIYNYKIAIVSSAPREEILLNMKHAKINIQSLDLITSGEDDLTYIKDQDKNKPKPYIYLHAAKILNVQPKNCIVFEDTHAGVKSAFTAGMQVYAVPNRLTAKQDFSEAKSIVSFQNHKVEDFIKK